MARIVGEEREPAPIGRLYLDQIMTSFATRTGEIQFYLADAVYGTRHDIAVSDR